MGDSDFSCEQLGQTYAGTLRTRATPNPNFRRVDALIRDAQGQPVTTNYGEYLLVASAEMPPVEIIHRETPSPLNALGIKGVGESGVIPIPAAIVSAVEDALAPYGVRISQAPIRPAEIVAWIQRSSGETA